jgi:hypothetical protein
MAQRGRKTELKLIEPASTDNCERPDAPSSLTGEQRDEWISLCNSLPPDFFPRPVQGILEQLCRHRIVARRLAEMIHATGVEKFDARLRYLLREQRNESMTIVGLLRQLRLTPMSVKPSSRTAIPSSTFPKPWEN